MNPVPRGSLAELRSRVAAIEDEAELRHWSRSLASDPRAGARRLADQCLRRARKRAAAIDAVLAAAPAKRARMMSKVDWAKNVSVDGGLPAALASGRLSLTGRCAEDQAGTATG